MMNLISVDSNMIAAAGYDPASRLLVVLFNTGRAYEYYDVPSEVYEGLMQAQSKGSYVNANIKGVYQYAIFKGWKRNSHV